MIIEVFGDRYLCDPNYAETARLRRALDNLDEVRGKASLIPWCFLVLVFGSGLVMLALKMPLWFIVIVWALGAIITWGIGRLANHRVRKSLEAVTRALGWAEYWGAAASLERSPALAYLTSALIGAGGFGLKALMVNHPEHKIIVPIVLAYVRRCNQQKLHPIDWNQLKGIAPDFIDRLSLLANRTTAEIVELIAPPAPSAGDPTQGTAA